VRRPRLSRSARRAVEALIALEQAAEALPVGTWKLVTSGMRAVEGAEADMNDQGQARLAPPPGYQGWRVGTFTRDHPGSQRSPRPWIIVWTYVVIFQGHYHVGVHYCWDIRRGCGYPSTWNYGGWIPGGDDTPYGTFREAFSAARAEAMHIAEGTPEVQAQYPEIFDWDGVPW
jgi:hypothetical protein